jgi:transcription elongation factor Elf1
MSNIIYKECKHHGLTEFFNYEKGYYRCRKCLRERNFNRRKELKKLAIEYKGGKCCRCGYNKSMRALIFHHLDSTQKDFGIARIGRDISWEKVKKELDKCILVCSNCHGEIEDEIEENKKK